MHELSIDANIQTFNALRSAYSEKHRHYHTTSHIEFCLVLFSKFRCIANEPTDVQLAIWFHDAIYNPMSSDNEERSADWAATFLRENGCAEEQCNRVRGLILATMHDAPAADQDTQLLVDIDLAILGVDRDSYQEFEKNVRREYKWVPGPLFRRERRKILQSFLDRKSIYSTKPFRETHEGQARRNIESALNAL